MGHRAALAERGGPGAISCRGRLVPVHSRTSSRARRRLAAGARAATGPTRRLFDNSARDPADGVLAPSLGPGPSGRGPRADGRMRARARRHRRGAGGVQFIFTGAGRAPRNGPVSHGGTGARNGVRRLTAWLLFVCAPASIPRRGVSDRQRRDLFFFRRMRCR